MPRDQEQTPEDIFVKLMLAADFLMEETSPVLATPIEPNRDALEAWIAVLEQAAEELGTIAAASRTILKLVHR